MILRWCIRGMEGVPDPLAIRCPRCGGEARFEDAGEWLKGDEARAAWERGDLGVRVNDRFLRARYPRLGWKRHGVRWLGKAPWGICRCLQCGYLNPHRLSWPYDLYFVTSVRGHTLWALTRAHVTALREYVASKERQRPTGMAYGIANFLRHIPADFLRVKNRDEVLRKLDRLLADGPDPAVSPAPPRRHKTRIQ